MKFSVEWAVYQAEELAFSKAKIIKGFTNTGLYDPVKRQPNYDLIISNARHAVVVALLLLRCCCWGVVAVHVVVALFHVVALFLVVA